MLVCELQNDIKEWHHDWREFITETYYELKKSFKKLKDPLAVTVTEIGVMCAGQKFLLGQQPIVVLDKLIKMIKVPEKRTTTIDCIFFIITSLFRNYDQTEFDISKDLMLEKIRIEIFHTLRKGTHKECIPALVDLVFLICIFDIKSAFPNFILPMVAPESSLELQVIGMLTFNAIADSTHVTFDKTFAFTKRSQNPIQANYRRSVHTNLRLEEFGSSSLNLSESMLELYRAALGKVILNSDSSLGPLFQTTRAVIDPLAKPTEKNLHLEVLRTAIQCISRIPPSNGFSSSELMQFLVYKSFHADLRISDEAKSLLIALVRTRPVLRSTIIESLGKFILTIPEENTALLRFSGSFLITLLMTWHDPLALNAREIDNDFIDSDVCSRRLFSASLIEGIALILLCNPSVHVRNVAFNILHEVRILNSVLPDTLAERGVRVLDVISTHENQLIQQHFKTYGAGACHFRSVEEIIVGCSEGDQEEWARCLGSLVPLLRDADCHSIYFAFSLICVRIETLTVLFFPIKKEKPVNLISKDLFGAKDDSFDELILWRNLLLLACAIAQGETSAFASEFGYESVMDISWLIDMVLPGLFVGSERVRNALQLALRYSKDSVAFTFPNLVYLHIEGQQRKEVNHNKELVRIESARLYGNLTELYLYSSLVNRHLETRALNFISETLDFLSQPTQESLCTLQQQRCDFFKICACLFEAIDKKSSSTRALKPSESQQLLNFTLAWSGHGPLYWAHKEYEMKMKESVLDKVKDKDISAAEEQFQQDLFLVQGWANKTLPGLLKLQLTYEDETFQEGGPLFLYASSVFELETNEDRKELARSALVSAIQNNGKHQEEMMKISVRYSYHSDPQIALNYSLTVCEVVTSPGDVSYPLLEVLCLSFYKLTDPVLSVRRSASELLHWLSTRFFRTHLSVLFHYSTAQTKENYTRQLHKFTKEFASLHGDLVVEVIMELMKRISELSAPGQHRMASLVISFLSYLDLDSEEPALRIEVLKTILLVSKNLAELRGDLVASIWSSLAHSASNVKHITVNLFSIMLAWQNFALLELLQSVFVYFAEFEAEYIFEQLCSDLYSTTRRSPASVATISCSDAHIKVSSNQHTVGIWNFDELFPKNTLDAGITKGEIVLVVLSELIQIPDSSAWKIHIPTLFVASLISMDHSVALVYESAKILLSNLIYCSVESNLIPGDSVTKPYRKFHSMIQISGSQPLWSNKEEKSMKSITKMNSTVSLSFEILHDYVPNIITSVSAEALQVASRINLSSHCICRALTLFRCIDLPHFTSNDIHELMGVLLLHIQNRESRSQVSVVIEIQKVFERIIEISSPDELIELPKIFWCGVALLRSDISRDYLSGVAILRKFVEKIPFSSDRAQQNLHSCYPYSWSPEFPGLAILLLKGFCSKEQEESSRKLICSLIDPLPSDIVDIDVPRAHVVFIVSLLPHLLTFLGGENAKEIAQMISHSLASVYPELSSIFAEYEVYRSSMEGLRRFLLEVVNKFTFRYFPEYESFVITVLIGMLEKGPKQHSKTILQIIEALLQHVKFETSKLFDDQLGVFAPILDFLQGDLWPQAMDVMEVIFARSATGTVAKFGVELLPQIRSRILECQKIYDSWNQLEQGKAIVFSALAKVMQTGEEENSGNQLDAHKANMKRICATLKAPRSVEDGKARKKRKKVPRVHAARRKSKGKKSAAPVLSTQKSRSINSVLREPVSRKKEETSQHLRNDENENNVSAPSADSVDCDSSLSPDDGVLLQKNELENELLKVIESEQGETEINLVAGIPVTEDITQKELDGCPFLKSPAPSISSDGFAEIQVQQLKIENTTLDHRNSHDEQKDAH